MKKILLIILILISNNLFAQDWDDDENRKGHHRKNDYKRDYFSIGLYGGYYLTSGLISQSGATINSVTFEAEYVQTETWAFYTKEICGFFNNDIGNLIDVDEFHSAGYTITNYNAPTIMILSGNFGVRYYVRNKNFNPYFQLGLSNEDFYKGEYSYTATSSKGMEYQYKSKQSNQYNLSLAFGGGIKIKLNNRFAVDLQCDMYRSITEKQRYYSGATFLAGLKYNL